MAGQKGRSGSGGKRKGAGRPVGAVDAQPRFRIAKSLSVPRWEIAEYTLQYAYKALDVFVEVMEDVEAQGAARVLAASKILDRALGTAPEHGDVTALRHTRRWYEANTGQAVIDAQRKIRHPVLRWMGATLDGRVQGSDAVFEAKFMLPWSFSEEAAAEKYMPQLQHNMWVVAARTAVLSVITGGGKWVEILAHADPLYQHLIVTAERKFWRCVESGEQPRLFGVEPPKPRLEAVRIVDMTSSNAWAEFTGIFARTRAGYLEHEQAKAELKGLMPEDAKEAIGHGVRAKRSKTGAVSFDLMTPDPELSNAAV